MADTRSREMDNSIARGVGVVLVIALSGLLVAGFSFMHHPGMGMMGPQPGNYSFNDVCTPPTNLVGQTIDVTVSDMGMMMGPRMSLSADPSTIASGKVNIVVSNFGMRTHEVVVLPLADGQVAGQRVVGTDGKVDETGSLGEVSNNCASGAGEGILSGSHGWTTLTLAPGRYELVCNLPNHYAAGMYQEIVVSA